MSAKDVFLSGFYGVFDKTAADEKPMPPFMKKKEEKPEKDEKDEKKEKKEEKAEKEPEEKAASIFMDGFASFFEKAAGEVSPLDSALEKLGKKWIAGAIKHKGGLHKSLGIAPGKDIPEKKKEEAAKKKGKVGKQGRLALTLAKLRK